MPPESVNLIPPSDLPDLGSLGAHSPRMALRRIFQQGGAQEHRAYVLQLNAVRLSDTALSEYSYARSTIQAFHLERQGFGVGYITRASGHFENCIWAFERFIKHAVRFVPPRLSRRI